MSLNTAETKPKSIEPTIPPAVTGWLLFLCVVLTLLYPAISLYHILTYTVPLLFHSRNPGFIFLLSRCVVWTALAVFSFLAGLKLWLVRPGAVRFARRWLWSYLIAHIADFVLFIVVAKPRQFVSVAGTGWYNVVVPIASFAFWYSYLEHSKRVRATYLHGSPTIQTLDLGGSLMTNGSVTVSLKDKVLLVLGVSVGILLSFIRALVWSGGILSHEALGYAFSGPLLAGVIAYVVAGRKNRYSASRFALWFVSLCLLFLLMELVH